MNQAREHDNSGDDAPNIEPAVIEQTPLERSLWKEATAPVLPGESREDWQDEINAIAALDEGKSADERMRASYAREKWRDWQWRFLRNLRLMQGVVSLACRATSISMTSVNAIRSQCKYYDEAVTDAMKAADDRIEASLRVSATVGDPEPVFQGGVCVGFKRKKSDRAAEMLLRAKRPNEWRPDGGNQVAISLALPTGDAVAEAMARLTAPEVPALECGTSENEAVSVEKE